MSKRPTLIRGKYIDIVGRNGRRSYKPLRNFMQYLAYGHYADRLDQSKSARGIWLDHAGRTQTLDKQQMQRLLEQK